MLAFAELDKAVTLAEQMSNEVGPVVLINLFAVPAETTDRFLHWYENGAKVMKHQPGYISTQLYRGIAGSNTMMNYAVWESVADFKAAFTNPQFRAAAQHCPDGVTGSPHLFQKVAVPGLCVG